LLGMPVKCSTKRFHFLFIQRHHQHAWQTTKWGKTLVIHNLRSHIQNIKGVYESIKQWSAWLNKITGGYNSSIWKGTECKASLGYPMRPCLHKKKKERIIGNHCSRLDSRTRLKIKRESPMLRSKQTNLLSSVPRKQRQQRQVSLDSVGIMELSAFTPYTKHSPR
jgi:hypothetical protein